MADSKSIDEQNDFLNNLYYYLTIATKVILKSFNWIVVGLVAVFLFILTILSLIFNRNDK